MSRVRWRALAPCRAILADAILNGLQAWAGEAFDHNLAQGPQGP